VGELVVFFFCFGSKIWYHTNSYVCTFLGEKERQGMDRREKDELKPDRPAKISSPSINLFLILDQINTCRGNLQRKPKRERKCQDEDLEVDHQVEAEEGAVRRVGVVEEAAVAGTSPILLLMYV
jgi:hypothetical protein